METHEGKALVRRYLKEIINEGHFEVAAEILAPDYVNHTAGGGIGTGRDDYVKGVEALRTAFPDWHVEEQAMLAEGDMVSDRLQVTATHTGQAAGIVPVGASFAGEVVHMWRVANGRLAEGWYFGTPTLMNALFAAITPP